MDDSAKIIKEIDNLRNKGLTLPRHPARAFESLADAQKVSSDMHKAAGRDLDNLGVRLGRPITSDNYDSPEVQKIMKENKAQMNAMGQKRAMTSRMNRTAGTIGPGTPMGGDAYNAIPRFYDPLEYWDLAGIPWNVADEGHRHKLHKWMRLYYATHYLVPELIDIFSRFPLVGMEVEVKDPAVKEIYENIFLDNLNYEEFLVNLGREYFLCALPGELIQTESGVKPIEDIEVYEKVLTHTGDFQPVLARKQRAYAGSVRTIRPHYGLSMTYTHGHPFLVRRDGFADWMPIEKIKKTDELFVPVDNSVNDIKSISVWDTLDESEWMPILNETEISELEIPEYVTWTDSEAKYKSYIRREVGRAIDNGASVGDVWKMRKRAAQHSPLKSTIEINDEFLWFVGIYLAEGSVSKDGVIISLGPTEQDYAQKVVDYAASLGLDAVTYIKKNHIIVRVYSIAFGAWIHSLIGTGFAKKEMPEWMLKLSEEKLAVILRGYFDGDGCYGDVRVHAASASYKLAHQVERAIRKLGIVTTINKSEYVNYMGKECTLYMIGPCKADTNKFMEKIGLSPNYADRERAFAEWDDNGYWVKVFKIEDYEYEGMVYNLTVDKDNSYVGSVATHNCGEAFPLASFDEDLGVWEHEELINPEDVVIDNFPLLNSQQLKIVPPDYLKRIAQTQSPKREWYMLNEHYSDIIPYLLKGEHIPISPVLLRQVANKLNSWDDHGTPILLRGLRTLLHEEKLLASQDAIAERLYSPFILAKLGIMDMGPNLPPWIPTPDELEAVRDDLDIAFASDFRVMVHHFGLELTSVFGREQMPRLGDDFDRIERRLMEIFGVNPSLLSAGSNAQPYASSALQAELMNQILRTFQKTLKDHFRERAAVVAEAQGHYEYEKKGDTRVPVYEQIVVYDEEGNKEIRKVNKLMIPELDFASFDMRDEATERQFVMQLRAAGLPIPDKKIMIGIDNDYNEMVAEYNKELMIKTLAQQQAKMKTYKALTIQGMPVPMDLKAECESVLMYGGGMPAPEMGGAGGPTPPPQAGGPPQLSQQNGVTMPPPPGGGPAGQLGPGPGTAPPGGGAPPAAPMRAGPSGSVPQVSNERRPGLKYNARARTSSVGVPAEKLMREKELGLAFRDYLEDRDALLSDAKRVRNLHRDWNLHSAQYEQKVQEELLAFVDELQKTATSAIMEDIELPKESEIEDFELPEFVESPDHKLVKNAGEDKIDDLENDEYILKLSKTRTPIRIETSKKYSVIDPLASMDETIKIDKNKEDKNSEKTDKSSPPESAG